MDAVRASPAARKASYEQGFREWTLLRQQDNFVDSSVDALDDPGLLPLHPHFPVDLELELWGNTLYAVRRSKWRSGCGSQDIPDFTKEFRLGVSVQKPTTVSFENSACDFPIWFGNDGGHLGVLVLAWAYILSARWAEVMPGAGICYTETDERGQGNSKDKERKDVSNLATGTKNARALQWWRKLVVRNNFEKRQKL
ncbi:hypothetical protein Daus18300_012663 [Diaporthe australafricana]|uniref:Uncharacterized protein n=1 Tax=Diaporthe australafricana TaxID=127596 RepID=A0ABR3W1X5_9PEZI